MRLRVDVAKCAGHARCIEYAPEIISLNDEGYNSTPVVEVPKGLEEKAKMAAASCPEGIITIEE